MAPIPFPDFNLDRAANNALSNLAKRLPTPPTELLGREPAPTPTTPSSLLSRILHPRATTSIIPTGYGSIDSGPSPGTVVGIVLGSVGGFLLVLWLFYTCINFGGGWGGGSTYTESVVVRERDRRKSHHGSHRSRRASETVEIRETTRVQRPPSRSPIRIVREPSPARSERIIVEERREERRAPIRRDSDEVVVIEEHSPPRRKKSHREREERDREVESGFRTVDPLAYGGVVGGNSRRGSRRRD